MATARKGAATVETEDVAPPSAKYFSLDSAGDPEHAITLNGVVYAMSTADDLSILDQEKLQRFYIKIHEVRTWQGDDDGLLSQEQEDLIADLELRFAQVIVPDAPRAELAAVPAHRRARLVKHFTNVVDQTPFIERVLNVVLRGLEARRAAQQATLTQMRPRTERGRGTDTTTTDDAAQPTESPAAATEVLAD